MIPENSSLDLGGEDVPVRHFHSELRIPRTYDLLIFPGRHTADASAWSAIVTMLATLDFNLAKDADGNDITFKATFTSGITEYVLNPPTMLRVLTVFSEQY